MEDGKFEQIELVMSRAREAAAVFGQLDQEHVDRIVRAVYLAGMDARVRLAKMAAEETGMGRWQDKVIKNVVATQYVYENIKSQKTAGIISENDKDGIIEIAQPIGPILAVTPVTNPTSTVMFKILIALKTRNPVIISPHRKAAKCSVEAARICYEAALSEDAPEHCVQWSEHKSREETQALMRHKSLSLILATGGESLVHEAYSSGTPAIGVGAGNVPVFIEKSADIPFAVEQIMLSKTFDCGTICASEQAVVVETPVLEVVKKEFAARKAVFLDPSNVALLEKVAFDPVRGLMNADIVGQPAVKIARMAGIDVPADTVLLIAPLESVGPQAPLSREILAPILAFYTVPDFNSAANVCMDLNFFGGTGHTVSIFSNDNALIKKFALIMDAGRICVNMPSSQGAVGGIYNTLEPSFTLGCGTTGKNITTDNISARHLLNIQRITKRRINDRTANFDMSKYLDDSRDALTLEKEFNNNY